MLHNDPISERLRRTNWFMLLMVLGFCIAGTLMMLSAGAGEWGEYAKAQIIRFILGVICMGIVMLCPPQLLFRLAYIGFAALLLMLIAVEIMGHIGMGAQRWLRIGGFTIQPSEFMDKKIGRLIHH